MATTNLKLTFHTYAQKQDDDVAWAHYPARSVGSYICLREHGAEVKGNPGTICRLIAIQASAAHDGVEVILQDVESGEQFTLSTEDELRAFDVYIMRSDDYQGDSPTARIKANLLRRWKGVGFSKESFDTLVAARGADLDGLARDVNAEIAAAKPEKAPRTAAKASTNLAALIRKPAMTVTTPSADDAAAARAMAEKVRQNAGSKPATSAKQPVNA